MLVGEKSCSVALQKIISYIVFLTGVKFYSWIFDFALVHSKVYGL